MRLSDKFRSLRDSVNILTRRPLPRHIQKSLEYYHTKRDAEENKESSPPPEEKIDLQCQWIAEIYLPSHFQDLLDGVRRLDWADPDPMGSREGLENWLRRAGAATHGRASIPLHAITRPGTERFGSNFKAPLPDGIEYARGYIHNFLGPVFVVVMQFVLTEDRSRAVDTELKTDHTTFSTKTRNGWVFETPARQKERACKEARTNVKQECAAWFQDELPGVFSSYGDANAFPAAECLMTKVAVPFAKPLDNRMNNYMHILGMDNDFYAYKSTALPGVAVGYSSFGLNDSVDLVLATKETDFYADASNEDWESWGGRNRDGYSNRLSDYDGSIAAWALFGLYRLLEVRLSEVRASALLGNVESVQDAQSQLLRMSHDIISACPILERMSSNLRFFLDEVDTCHPMSDVITPRPHFFETVRERLASAVPELRQSEKDIRETLLAQGSLIASATQQRAASAMVALTVVLVALTVALILIAVFQGGGT